MVVKVEVILLVSENTDVFCEVRNSFISYVTQQFCKWDFKIIHFKYHSINCLVIQKGGLWGGGYAGILVE